MHLIPQDIDISIICTHRDLRDHRKFSHNSASNSRAFCPLTRSLLVQLKIEDASRRLRTHDLGIPPNPEDRFDRRCGVTAQRLPREEILGRLIRNCSITMTFTLQFTVFVNNDSRLMCHTNHIWRNPKYDHATSTVKRLSLSVTLFWSMISFFKILPSQFLKNNSYLQSGETQCALFPPTLGSSKYFSPLFNFCFTEFNEIVCRVGVRLGPH